jgi:hypothetical protein
MTDLGVRGQRIVAVEDQLPYRSVIPTVKKFTCYHFCHSDAERGGGICHTTAREKRSCVYIMASIATCYGLELLVTSLPQHSGRLGRLDRSHPPPRASINNTALAIRRPRIFTEVTSSDKAAF